MKKITTMILTILMVMPLAACGSGAKSEKSEYEGKWISVAGEAMGMTLTGEDIKGFEFELQNGGKGTMNIEDESGKVKWKEEDGIITITIDGEEAVGKIEGDTIVFDDMLGMGLKLTFAKEGTDAANPENYIPEEDKAMVGLWKSNAVTDVLGDPVEGVTADALTMEFAADYTVKVTLSGTEVGTYSWSIYGGHGSIDSDDDTSISWNIGTDSLKVDYSIGEEYYVFTCVKSE